MRPVAPLLITLCLAAGCGTSEETLYPVKGQVTINGAPLTKGTVGLIPDLARGNNSPYTPQGNIGPDGTYSIATLQREGAAPGWYKVAVWAAANEPASDSYQDMQNYKPQWLVNVKYTQADTTDLSVEVVPNTAGAYDLKLSQ